MDVHRSPPLHRQGRRSRTRRRRNLRQNWHAPLRHRHLRRHLQSRRSLRDHAMKRGLLAAVLLIASSAHASSTFKVLHSFHCDPGGCGPNGGLAFYAAGNLHGTTPGGGNTDATIFRLAPSSGDHWTYSPLHTLTLSEGSSLDAALVVDPAGNLYGTSQDGGAHDWGSVFELTPGSGPVGDWTLHVLHSFLNGYLDGQSPWDKVALDMAGNVYGTTREGGPEGAAGGVIFKLTSGKGGGWTEKILYGFPSNRDGCCSQAELIF